MNEIVIVLMVVMIVMAALFVIVAIYEFIQGMIEGSKKKEEPRVIYYDPTAVQPQVQPARPVVNPTPVVPVSQPQPEVQPVVQQPAPAPVVEPAPQVAPAPAPQPVVEPAPVDDGNTVAFGVSATRLTIKEEYEKLDKRNKKRFDAIMDAAKGFEKARVKESQYAITIMQGQDSIGKLKFAKGVPTLDVTIVNPNLKAYGKEKGTKIKNKPIRFKIVDDDTLSDAIYTLKLANDTSFEARQKKKAE